MEPKSNVSELQPEAWREFITADLSPRAGQAATWNAAATEPAGRWIGLVVLPTGYGKTLTACGAFVVLRARALATHMLVVVPTDQQREQWVEGAARNFGRLGARVRHAGAIRIEKEPREFNYVQPGGAEVFVATYAQLLSDDGFWERLTSVGSWLVVFDECHHLAEDGSWARGCAKLRCAHELYLSATPIRTDRKPLMGAPVRTIEGGWEVMPTVHVSVAEAIREGAVRWPVLHKHHYFVDVSKADGSTERLTTESLSPEAKADYEAYEARYQLRYRDEYISSMLLDAGTELNARLVRHPEQHQMLVFAITCKHASFVTDVLNKMFGAGFADCVGVHRRTDENASVFGRYSANKLPCLVQVEKAGEGFDNPRTSVLVFLNLVNSRVKVAQHVGRCQRRNHAVPQGEDDAAVFASADSAVAAYITTIDAECSEIVRERVPRDERSGEDESARLRSLPSINVIGAEFVRSERFGPNAVVSDEVKRGEEIARRIGISGLSAEQLAMLGRETSRERITPSAQAFVSETAALTYWKDRADHAVKTLAGNAVRASRRTAIEGNAFGRMLHAINSEWNRVSGKNHGGMVAEDFKRKYHWIEEINSTFIRTGNAPAWLG